MPDARFVFVLCAPGSEPLAKAEIARVYPTLRLSFSRPGLLTFKDPTGTADERFGEGLVFARRAGLSLGLAKDADEVVARAPKVAVVSAIGRDGAPEDGVEAAVAAKIGAEVRPARPGDRVLTVVAQPGEPWLCGLHVHGETRWPVPATVFDLPERVGSPSRAGKKLDEALAWSGLAMARGETALELGGAPGGMTLSMLEAGVHVIAVDPAAMSPDVLAHVGPGGARVRHLAIPAGAVRVADLPPLEWLVVDLNLAPPVALRYVARVVRARMPKHAAIITLKLNDAAMAEAIPEHLERIRAMGFSRVRATQLPSNRTEITAVARR